MQNRKIVFIVWLQVIAGLASTATLAQQPDSAFELSGKWRGTITIRDSIAVPFNFEIDAKGQIFFLNATERFQSENIRLHNDSLIIPFDQFNNELVFRIESNDRLQGLFRRQDGTGRPLRAQAEKGRTDRFADSNTPPSGNISGVYQAVFTTPSGEKRKSVVILEQRGKMLTGTFLKISGDSRYLEGIVEGNRFYLSSFIGSSPAYYTGTFDSRKIISGEQIGSITKQQFTASPDADAALPDAYALTHLKEGYHSLDFSFPDLQGNMVSLRDPKYKGKVVILAITGTWCPNCLDEAAFLSPWYKENAHRGVEVISVHYELRSDTAFVRRVLNRFRERFDITYDQVFAGTSSAENIKRSLPALRKLVSFPTTIFIDKKGNVAKIHTGYSGPATGKYYEEFKKEFNEEVDRLLAQE